MEYRSKIELSISDVGIIWNEFSAFFEKTNTANIERISNNEAMGRYVFVTKNSMGDEIECAIYLPVNGTYHRFIFQDLFPADTEM